MTYKLGHQPNCSLHDAKPEFERVVCTCQPITVKTDPLSQAQRAVTEQKTTWTKIANILASIQNGDGAKFEELQGIERAFIEQETNAICEIMQAELTTTISQAKQEAFVPTFCHNCPEKNLTGGAAFCLPCVKRVEDKAKQEERERIVKILKVGVHKGRIDADIINSL